MSEYGYLKIFLVFLVFAIVLIIVTLCGAFGGFGSTDCVYSGTAGRMLC